MTQAFKILLSAVMAYAPALSFAQPVPAAKPPQLECGQKLLNACHAKGATSQADYEAATGVVAATTKDKMHAGAAGLQGTSTTASGNFTSAAKLCREQKSQCASECGRLTPETRRSRATTKCQDTLEAYAGEMDNRAAGALNTAGEAGKTAGETAGDINEGPVNPGGGGGGMGMLGTAALAAGAGLLGYMLGNKKSKDKKGDDEDGALQENGTLNCSKDDAYEYMDCNPYLAQACSAKMLNNTYAGDKACQNFAGRFCGAGSASSGSAVSVSQVSAGTPAKGAVGEGLSQNPGFCQSVLAFNFCQGSGRAQCPSCLQLVANQAPACLNDKTLCMAQNSADQLNQAKNTCPTDPIFANPDMLKTGSQVATEIAGGAALPVATLPSGTGSSQVVSTGTSSTGTVTAATGGAATQVAANTGGTVVTFSTASVGGARDGAVREGAGGGPASQAAYGDGGGRGMNPIGNGSGATNGREIAMAGGMRPSSSNRGPASDVQGQYGPSVFAMGTQVYRQRCQAGKLNNCP